MRQITPEPLTQEAFAPFGRVIEASDAATRIDINQGHAVRYDALAEIDVADGGGKGMISLFRARPLTPKPVTPHPVTPAKPVLSDAAGGVEGAGAQLEQEPGIVLKTFERHPLGSQTFVPLSGRPYLVAVAPPGEFDAAKVRVFRAEGHQGVHYAKGTWHHFLLVLDEDSDFLVVDRAGSGENCEEVALASTDAIRIGWHVDSIAP